MAKRKKNKQGRGSVAEETQTNPPADDTGVPSEGQASDGDELRPEGETLAQGAAVEEAPSQEPAQDLVTEDASVEDASVEDASAGEASEEQPAQDPVVEDTAESLSEEHPVPESVAEDTAESLSEEQPAQEPVAEDAAGEEPAEEACAQDMAAEDVEASADAFSAEGDEPTEDGVESGAENDVVEGEVTHPGDAESASDPAAEPSAVDEKASDEDSVWGDEVPTNPRVSESSTAEEDAKVWESAGETGEAAPAAEGDGDEPKPLDIPQMQSIIESLLFASDRALAMSDFKRLLNERDGKKIQAALEDLAERRRESGIHVVHLATGWHLRTNHENGDWVSKLLAGKPMRLSRAMMETLAIVAYRQPVTRPEIDDIRGVDCGPVLKTLLDRGLIRIIGKKEEVGRPMLYGTTPEFLRVFNLRDLSDLPTLREFYELSEDQQASVTAKHGPGPEGAAGEAAPGEAASGEAASGEAAPEGGASAGTPTSKKEPPKLSFVSRQDLPPEDEDADPLLDELEDATKAATKALGQPTEPTPETPDASDEAPAAEAEPEKTEPPSEG